MTTDSQTPSDGELLAQARAGRREAFGRLVDRHKDKLVSYLTRLTGQFERAEDLAQEAFLRLYGAAPRYEERGHLQAYLFRIATNLLRSEERRAARWRRLRAVFASTNGHGSAASAVRAGGGWHEAGSDPAQERRLIEIEIGERVAEAISGLPLRYRAPLVLREIEGLAYREIGEALGCQVGTIKSRIHRGRALLRDRLESYWTGGGA